MALTVVMYHYVRPPSSGHPGLKALHVEDFRRQLDHLAETGPIVARDALLRAVEARGPLPEGWVLSFDDGLRDHVDHVLPELERRGWWGLFHLPSGPARTGRPLDVHLTHGLLARHGGPAVWSVLEPLVAGRRLSGDGAASYRGHDEDTASLAVRRTLNHDLAPDERGAVLDRLDRELGSGVTVDGWYLGPDEVRRLRDAGMVIGAHSRDHRPLAQLDAAAQRAEIDDSFSWLEEVAGSSEPRIWCHPYGGPTSFTSETEQILASAGVRWAFAATGGPIEPADVAQRPHALPRVDCCELPHGRSR